MVGRHLDEGDEKRAKLTIEELAFTMLPEPIRKTFISAQSLLQDSFELGRQVVKSGFRPTFLVGVLLSRLAAE